MKKIFSLFIILAVTMFVSSCEDVVQIKLDEGSKLYVIDAFVDDLPGVQTIRVTTNDNYFSNRISPPVGDAKVELKDVTSGQTYLFNYVGDGNYTYTVNANSPIAVIDHQYDLNVTIGGNVYSAFATQKRRASIDSITPVLASEFNGGFGTPDTTEPFVCILYAKDKTDANTDYYWIKTFRNDTVFPTTQGINICVDGTGGPVSGIDVDSTSFTPGATFLGFNTFHHGDKCKVQIHSIEKGTYFFFTQAQAQINNGGLFATTPENVKTNIRTPSGIETKAVGWFNIASTVSHSIVVP